MKVKADYTLNGMIYLLKNKKKLESEAYRQGKTSSVEFLIDLDLMMKQAKFTERQQQIIQLHYVEDYTQEEVAQMFGVKQQAINCSISAIKQKIKTVLNDWGC